MSTLYSCLLHEPEPDPAHSPELERDRSRAAVSRFWIPTRALSEVRAQSRAVLAALRSPPTRPGGPRQRSRSRTRTEQPHAEDGALHCAGLRAVTSEQAASRAAVPVTRRSTQSGRRSGPLRTTALGERRGPVTGRRLAPAPTTSGSRDRQGGVRRGRSRRWTSSEAPGTPGIRPLPKNGGCSASINGPTRLPQRRATDKAASGGIVRGAFDSTRAGHLSPPLRSRPRPLGSASLLSMPRRAGSVDAASIGAVSVAFDPVGSGTCVAHL